MSFEALQSIQSTRCNKRDTGTISMGNAKILAGQCQLNCVHGELVWLGNWDGALVFRRGWQTADVTLF